MTITKVYIGKNDSLQKLTHYYLIQKDSYYGVELVQDGQPVQSTLEWVSENREETLALAHTLCIQGVSPMHLSDIIDDYIQ